MKYENLTDEGNRCLVLKGKMLSGENSQMGWDLNSEENPRKHQGEDLLLIKIPNGKFP